MPHLRKLASKFSMVDVFDADEFVLKYTAKPTPTVGPASLKGLKKSKERVTFLVCCNVDGTEHVGMCTYRL